MNSLSYFLSVEIRSTGPVPIPRGQPKKHPLQFQNSKVGVVTVPVLKKSVKSFQNFVAVLENSSGPCIIPKSAGKKRNSFESNKASLHPPPLSLLSTFRPSSSSNISSNRSYPSDANFRSKPVDKSPQLRSQERDQEEIGPVSLTGNNHGRSSVSLPRNAYACFSRSKRILDQNVPAKLSISSPVSKVRNVALGAPSNPISRVKQSLDVSKLAASIDLTNESDDEALTSGEAPPATTVDFPSRLDLLEVTGSVSTAVDLKDFEESGLTSQASSSESQSKSNRSSCDFLKKVGQDHAVLLKYKSSPVQERIPSAVTKDQVVVGTISVTGIGSYALSCNDLACLEGPKWLNDEVVNAYMCLLQLRSNLNSKPAASACIPYSGNHQNDVIFAHERSPAVTRTEQKLPKCLFFNSFFYALLRNARGGYSYTNVQRWGRRYNLAQMDRVFFPINISNSHWCLAVVFPQEWKIRYYDSLGGKNSVCLDLIERYLQDEGRYRCIDQLTRSWDKESVGPPSIPAQGDGCSCGVFVCAFADCLSAGQKSPRGFSQRDMPAIRSQIHQFFMNCRL